MTKPRCKTSSFCLLLIALVSASVSAADDLTKVDRIRRAPGNLHFTARWLSDDGLTLQFDGDQGTAVEVQLRREAPTAVFQTEDHDKANTAQFDIAGMPTDERDVNVLLKVRPAYLVSSARPVVASCGRSRRARWRRGEVRQLENQ